jgi:hypothetical protein
MGTIRGSGRTLNRSTAKIGDDLLPLSLEDEVVR